MPPPTPTNRLVVTRSTKPAEVRTALEAMTVTETVGVPAGTVYDFARTMENLPLWASGLAAGVIQENGEWFAESPMGRVKVEMALRNDFGVLDHDVTLPSGVKVHNAFRVTPAGDHSVLTFVVLRMPDVSAEDFSRDLDHVARDLKMLKTLLERGRAA